MVWRRVGLMVEVEVVEVIKVVDVGLASRGTTVGAESI